MSKRSRNKMFWVAISYLLLAGGNLATLIVIWAFMPTKGHAPHGFVDLLQAIGFPGYWIVINIVLSSILGAGVIFGGLERRTSGVLLILFGFVLIAVDLVPILLFLRQLISGGHGQSPWTLVPLVFHVYLEVLIIFSFRRQLQAAHPEFSVP